MQIIISEEMPKRTIQKDSKTFGNRSRYFLRPCQSKISFLQRIEQLLQEDGCKSSETNLLIDYDTLSIKKLPAEIMIKILSNLNVKDLSLSVAPVCRKWFLYSHAPALWRSLQFQDNSPSTQKALSLLRQAPELRRLEIIDRSDSDVLLMEVCHTNHQLEHLTIKCSYNPESHQLSPCAINFSTDPSYFDWQSIESIFDDNSLPYLPTGKKDYSYVQARILKRVLQSCRRLSSIKLIGIEMRSRRFFAELAQLPRLQNVDLTVGDRGGTMAWEMATLLRNHVGEGTRVNPLYLHAVYNWCDRGKSIPSQWRIQVMNMSHIFGFLSPCIVVLNLDAATMDDEMFEELIKCVSLQALHLNNALNVASTTVIRILTSLQNLVSLRINQAYRLRPPVLLAAFHYEMRSLECDKRKFPLKYLSMADCPGIDDASILAILSHCPQLEHLSFAQCQKITDEGLRCILWLCHNLRSLNLWNCTGLVGRNLAQIPTFAPRLKILMVGDQNREGFKDKRREENVMLLRKLMPHIRIHYSMVPPRGWTIACRDHNINL